VFETEYSNIVNNTWQECLCMGTEVRETIAIIKLFIYVKID